MRSKFCATSFGSVVHTIEPRVVIIVLSELNEEAQVLLCRWCSSITPHFADLLELCLRKPHKGPQDLQLCQRSWVKWPMTKPETPKCSKIFRLNLNLGVFQLDWQPGSWVCDCHHCLSPHRDLLLTHKFTSQSQCSGGTGRKQNTRHTHNTRMVWLKQLGERILLSLSWVVFECMTWAHYLTLWSDLGFFTLWDVTRATK